MIYMKRSERIKASAEKKAAAYAALVKKYEEKIKIRNQVLDMWSAGITRRKITEDLGVSSGQIGSIIMYARRMGDERAVQRRAGAKKEWVEF